MKRIQLTVLTILISFHMLSAQETNQHFGEVDQPIFSQEEKSAQRMPQKKGWWTKTKIIGASVTGAAASILGAYATYVLLIKEKQASPPIEMFPLDEDVVAPPSTAAKPSVAATTEPLKKEIAGLQQLYKQIVVVYQQVRSRETSPIIRLLWENMRGDFIDGTILPNLQQQFPQFWDLMQAKPITLKATFTDEKTFDGYIKEVSKMIDAQPDLTLKRRYYGNWIKFYNGMLTKLPLTQTEKDTLLQSYKASKAS